MSEERVDLRGKLAMALALIGEDLKAIISAIDDPRLDCEETMQAIREKAFEAQKKVELMWEALEPSGGR
jgi:hypothetical protein